MSVIYNPSIIELIFSQHIFDASRRASTKYSDYLCPYNYLYIAVCSFLFCALRDLLALVKRPFTESWGFQLSRFFNLDRGSLDLSDSLGPASTGGTEVLNEAMMDDCLAFRRTLYL